MSHTNFNMRLDNDLRQKVYPVLEQYGLTQAKQCGCFLIKSPKQAKCHCLLIGGSRIRLVAMAKSCCVRVFKLLKMAKPSDLIA